MNFRNLKLVLELCLQMIKLQGRNSRLHTSFHPHHQNYHFLPYHCFNSHRLARVSSFLWPFFLISFVLFLAYQPTFLHIFQIHHFIRLFPIDDLNFSQVCQTHCYQDMLLPLFDLIYQFVNLSLAFPWWNCCCFILLMPFFNFMKLFI